MSKKDELRTCANGQSCAIKVKKVWKHIYTNNNNKYTNLL